MKDKIPRQLHHYHRRQALFGLAVNKEYTVGMCFPDK